MTNQEDSIIARLIFQGEDGMMFQRGVTCLGDVPLAIRYQLGKVTDCGQFLQGDSGGKLIGFHVKGGPEHIFHLMPSTTTDVWVELARMANSFPDDLSSYNIQIMNPEVH